MMKNAELIFPWEFSTHVKQSNEKFLVQSGEDFGCTELGRDPQIGSTKLAGSYV